MKKRDMNLENLQDMFGMNDNHLIPKKTDSEAVKAYKNLVRNMLKILSKFTK